MWLLLGRMHMGEEHSVGAISASNITAAAEKSGKRRGFLSRKLGRYPCQVRSLPTADWPNNIPAIPRQPQTHNANSGSRI